MPAAMQAAGTSVSLLKTSLWANQRSAKRTGTSWPVWRIRSGPSKVTGGVNAEQSDTVRLRGIIPSPSSQIPSISRRTFPTAHRLDVAEAQASLCGNHTCTCCVRVRVGLQVTRAGVVGGLKTPDSGDIHAQPQLTEALRTPCNAKNKGSTILRVLSIEVIAAQPNKSNIGSNKTEPV